MYHISDIKKYLRCELLYFYSRDEANTFIPFLRADDNIMDLLSERFGIKEYFEGIRNDQSQRFLDNIAEYEWFYHPRLNDGELRINIPLVHKKDDGFDLYFLFYGTDPKDIDILSYRICTEIMEQYGFKVSDIYLISFNSDYVNEGKLDPAGLLKIEKRYRGKRIIDRVRSSPIDYKDILSQMETGSSESCVPQKKRYCRFYGLCNYYGKCFPQEENDADDSILTLVSSGHKNDMYDEGIRFLKDADLNRLEGNKVQYAQVMASRKGGCFIDRMALHSFLEKLDARPISFIDFEWDRYLIPAYEKMKPLDVVCFEFALYYIDEQGHMEHRTFVSTGDCRQEFVEALLEYLPDKGPILAYNAQGAECLRLKELSEIYPQYSKQLEAVIGRFVDLAVPFVEGVVYDVRMRGNFTLKKLVDICSDYSYHDLDIDDGMAAVLNWRHIDKGEETDGDKIVADLKEYCSLDAYGLFLVYRWLIQLMSESKYS